MTKEASRPLKRVVLAVALGPPWIYLTCSLEEVEECKERGEVCNLFVMLGTLAVEHIPDPP